MSIGYYDTSGEEIWSNDYVLVPEPNQTDIHNFSFCGRVVGFRNGYVQVMDQDNYVFEIEPERLQREENPF